MYWAFFTPRFTQLMHVRTSSTSGGDREEGGIRKEIVGWCLKAGKGRVFQPPFPWIYMDRSLTIRCVALAQGGREWGRKEWKEEEGKAKLL